MKNIENLMFCKVWVFLIKEKKKTIAQLVGPVGILSYLSPNPLASLPPRI